MNDENNDESNDENNVRPSKRELQEQARIAERERIMELQKENKKIKEELNRRNSLERRKSLKDEHIRVPLCKLDIARRRNEALELQNVALIIGKREMLRRVRAEHREENRISKDLNEHLNDDFRRNRIQSSAKTISAVVLGMVIMMILFWLFGFFNDDEDTAPGRRILAGLEEKIRIIFKK